MGEALPARRLSYASGRRAPRRLAARPALSRFALDGSGATAIEYAVLIACIGLAVITALSTLEGGIYGVINTAASAVAGAIG